VELAIRVGSPMIVAGLRRSSAEELRGGAKRFAMVFNPVPYRPDPGAEAKEEARRLTDELNAGLGDMILQAPEQWFWIHRRWKSEGQR
jgi:lauroyl/myristoyl acyltransferase